MLTAHASGERLPAPASLAVRGLAGVIEAELDSIAKTVEREAPPFTPPATYLWGGSAGDAAWCENEDALDGLVDRTRDAEFSYLAPGAVVSGAHNVVARNAPTVAALNIGATGGATTGRLVWEMKLDIDDQAAECTCFGFTQLPIKATAYDSGSNMWLWRAYNGVLYARGENTGRASPIHPGDTVKIELDLERGIARGWRNNIYAGVLWTGLASSSYYPCIHVRCYMCEYDMLFCTLFPHPPLSEQCISVFHH